MTLLLIGIIHLIQVYGVRKNVIASMQRCKRSTKKSFKN